MDDNKSNGIRTILVLVLVGVSVFFLVRGVEHRDPAAYMTLGAIVALALAALGGIGVLIVLWFAHRIQSDRERAEQNRFIANAQENLAMMSSMQRVQNQQNAMLLKQAKEAQRALPAPDGDTLNVGGFVFEDALFDELDE